MTAHTHSFHYVDDRQSRFTWDNAIPPVLEIESGDEVTLSLRDSSGGQIARDSDPGVLRTLDFTRVNPVTGPILVKNAPPGSVLMVEVLELRVTRDWGWSAIIPGFGLLADEFSDPWLRISDVDTTAGRVRFAQDVSLPLEPFPGWMGVAPREPGPHSTVPPLKWGGNLDIRHLTAGSTLLLPVGVEGALFSVGDGHAAMGDGELCGTAVEVPMEISLRMTVRKEWSIPAPQYHTLARPPRMRQQGGVHVCTGVGPDLWEATRDAARALIDHISLVRGREREEAYVIASVAADLRLHEVVDSPNWVVGACLPLDIFNAATGEA